MVILGCDPGKQGALAFYAPYENKILNVIDMPTLNVSKIKGKTQTVISWSALAEELRYMANYGNLKVTHAYLELVHSMPKQGVASSFAFGRGFGGIEAVIACFQWPLEYVTPQKWKQEFGLGHDKEASRAKASLLLPADTGLWTPNRKEGITKPMAEGRAEASLLAIYGARQQQRNRRQRVKL